MQKNIAPLRPELLLALHVVAQYLREFRHSEERDEDGYPLIDEAQEWMYVMTDDLLWGPLYFQSENVEISNHSNMAVLFEMMPQGAPAGLGCSITLPEGQEYQHTLEQELKHPSFAIDGETTLARELLAKKKIQSTLGQSFNLCKLLVDVRDEILRHGVTDIISFVSGERPVSLDYESQWDAVYRWITGILSDYCTAFRKGNIHWYQNIRQWEEQRHYFLGELRKRQQLYGADFWISSSVFQDAELKPIETLLCLEADGMLTIGQPRRRNDIECELLIHMYDAKKSDQHAGGEWIPCCDFFFQREPEFAVKKDRAFTFSGDTKSKAERDDIRKALRVLDHFAPRKNFGSDRIYDNARSLAKNMHITMDTLDSQLACANRILRQIGSEYKISKKAGNTQDQLGLVTE